MSRFFDEDDGTGEYLGNGSAIITTTPFTMACRFRTPNLDEPPLGHRTMVGLFHDTNTDEWSALRLWAPSAGDANKIFAVTRDGAAGQRNSTSIGTVSANTWHTAMGVWASATSRLVYLDGVAGTSSTDSRDPAFNSMGIGRFENHSSVIGYWHGDLAEMAMWSAALSQSDATRQAMGLSLDQIKPESLVHYWKIHGRYSPEIDVISGTNMTVNSTPLASEHPSVLRDGVPHSSIIAAVGGGVVSDPGAGSIVLAGQAPDLSRGRVITVPTGPLR